MLRILAPDIGEVDAETRNLGRYIAESLESSLKSSFLYGDRLLKRSMIESSRNFTRLGEPFCLEKVKHA